MNPYDLQSDSSKLRKQRSLRAGSFMYRSLRMWPTILVLYLSSLALWLLLMAIAYADNSSAESNVWTNIRAYAITIVQDPVANPIASVVSSLLVASLLVWYGQLLMRYRRNARLLKYIDKESVNVLGQILASPQRATIVRVHAAYALGEQTTSAIRALQQALADPEPAISKAAAAALLIALRDHISATSVLHSLPLSDLAEDLEAVLTAERALAALKRYYDEERQGYALEAGPDGEDNGVLMAEQAQIALERIGIEAPYDQILDIETRETRDLSYGLTH